MKLLLFSIFTFLCLYSYTQGLNDHSFNINDNGTYGDGSGVDQAVNDIEVQSDGKIIICGSFGRYNGTPSTNICRLNANGSVDTSFHPLFNTSTINTIFIQPDGKIIVGGLFGEINGILVNNIIRLNSDGTVDTSFNFGVGFTTIGGTNCEVKTITVQTDGKIIVGGDFNEYNGIISKNIIRLNSNGTYDPTFNCGSGFNNKVYSISLQSDGKIIVGGEFSDYNGMFCNSIARVNTNGSIDGSFTIGSGFVGVVYTTEVQNDNKILIGGLFTSYNGTNTSYLTRLNSNGIIDASFTDIGFNGSVYTIKIQSDGKLIIGGIFINMNFYTMSYLIRLNTDGTIDTSYDSGFGYLLPNGNKGVFSAAIQNDGKIVFAGAFEMNPNTFDQGHSIRRTFINGSNDKNFNIGTGFNIGRPSYVINSPHYLVRAAINSTAIQNDGKILVGGQYKSYNGIIQNNLTRLNVDGELDSTFILDNYSISDVYKILIQNDGKILVGGNLSYYNGAIQSNNILRLNTDGSIDTTFNIGDGFNGSVRSLSIQDDGKIIVGGNFELFNGVSRNKIARLNSDGSLDNSFVIGSGFGAFIYYVGTTAIQDDSKILVGGCFAYYNGSSSNYITRLNSNGSIDNTFNVGNGFNEIVNTINIQDDGKILVGGYFGMYNDTNVNRIVRLNSNGSIDNSFNTTSNFNGNVYTSYIQNDGKILVGGFFEYLNIVPVTSLVRLDTNGIIDSSFNIGVINPYQIAPNINSLSVQDDGKIIVGGDFSSCYGEPRNRIARLFPYFCSTYDTVTITNCNTYTWPLNGQTYTTSGNYSYTLINSNSNGCDSIITLLLTILPTNQIINNVTNCGAYIWLQNGQTYTNSGLYNDTLTNIFGCDSIITLNLTVFSSQSIENNLFNMPSSDLSCNGQLAISTTGNPDFEMSIDGTAPFTSTGYSLQSNLCPGIHELSVIDFCGDTVTQPFVIPIDSNFVFNNPFIDSIAVDSLGVTITNCDIYYNSIDTAFIDSLWATGNQVNVIWNIVDSNGSNLDTTTYDLMNASGVYWLQLSVFCPTKAVDDYFAITQAIYFGNGGAYLVGLEDNPIIENSIGLYPNPTFNSVTITFTSNSTASIQLLDAQGKFIQESVIHSGDQISLENLERGVYFLTLIVNKRSIIKKVVKQ